MMFTEHPHQPAQISATTLPVEGLPPSSSATLGSLVRNKKSESSRNIEPTKLTEPTESRLCQFCQFVPGEKLEISSARRETPVNGYLRELAVPRNKSFDW